MKLIEYSRFLSLTRMQRYLNACHDEQHAIQLYRLNMKLAQMSLSIVSVFEIILRNQINQQMQLVSRRPNWLEWGIQQKINFQLNATDSIKGIFTAQKIDVATQQIKGYLKGELERRTSTSTRIQTYNQKVYIQYIQNLGHLDYNIHFKVNSVTYNKPIRLHQYSFLKCQIGHHGIMHNALTIQTIYSEIDKLGNHYSHDKLIPELNFGFWRYLFADAQMNALTQVPLRIFPRKPIALTHQDIFRILLQINELRNRIAHHEPLCFDGVNVVGTLWLKKHIGFILELLSYMEIDAEKIFHQFNLLTELNALYQEINALKYRKPTSLSLQSIRQKHFITQN